MSGWKDKLIFDVADLPESDKVGSYLISSGGQVIDSTDVGGTEGLNVNVLNELSVDLDYTTDSVAAHQGGSWSVSITDGVEALAINVDGSINAVVTATDLDIRGLTQTDEVTVFQGTSPWVISDLAHTKDTVRLGDGTNLSAIDAQNRLLVKHSPNVGSVLSTLAVSDTAQEIASTPLAGRVKVMLENRTSKTVFLGSTSGVTTGTGFSLSKNGKIEMEYGEALDLFAISEAGVSGNLIIWELA